MRRAGRKIVSSCMVAVVALASWATYAIAAEVCPEDWYAEAVYGTDGDVLYWDCEGACEMGGMNLCCGLGM